MEFSPPPSSPESREVNYNTASAQPETSSTSRNSANEWESDTSNDDDWNFEQDINKTEKFSEQDSIRNSTTYEVNTQPKSSSRSGSVYSYSYREPSNSGVGKTESIYDADYRVLTPPYQQANATENEDDWGDEDWGVEDDDFKDEGKSNSSRQG